MSARDHLHKLHSLRCVVCTHMGINQMTRTVAHHLESIRDEDSDFGAVPLCDHHHKELHRLSRRGFTMLTKLDDIDLLKLTLKALDAA